MSIKYISLDIIESFDWDSPMLITIKWVMFQTLNPPTINTPSKYFFFFWKGNIVQCFFELHQPNVYSCAKMKSTSFRSCIKNLKTSPVCPVCHMSHLCIFIFSIEWTFFHNLIWKSQLQYFNPLLYSGDEFFCIHFFDVLIWLGSHFLYRI